MTVTSIALAVLMWTQAGGGANAAQDASALELRITGQITSASGAPQVTASSSDPRAVDSYIYVTSGYCGLGSTSTMPASAPLAGWHVSAHVVERSANGVKAIVQWQRAWDRGGVDQHPATGVSTLTLERDETVLLDTITPDQAPACGAASIRLTATAQKSAAASASAVAAMMDRLQTLRDGQGARAGASGGRGTGAASGGMGAASGGMGAASGAAGGGGGGASGSGRGGGGGGGRGGGGAGAVTGSGAGMAAGGIGASTGGRGFEAAAPGSLAAIDLWLLDRAVVDNSAGAFAVNQRYRMISLGASGSDFDFDPLIVDTPHGEVVVRISGRLVPVMTNGRLTSVEVRITRAVKGDGPPPLDVSGGATHTLSPLNSADVVAFELPSGERDDPGLLGNHHLSLRVRVR